MKLIRILILGIFVWSISSFALKQTDNFTLSKISSHFIETDNPPFDEALIQEPFTYLCKGGQSYVFLSHDRKYILKFFRASKWQNLVFLCRIFPLSSLKQKKQRAENLLYDTLNSYALAYHDLQEETALAAVHLTPKTKIHTPLKIIDKVGIAHTIDSNRVAFVVQKKAVLVKDHIENLMQKEGKGAAIEAMDRLFLFLKNQIQGGIQIKDPNLAKNFGFINGKPVQIDGGSLSKIEPQSMERLISSKEDMHHWLNSHFPELSHDFDRLFQEHIYVLF